jgi:ribonuclease P protein component
LKKSERLLKNKDFKNVYEKGKVTVSPSLILFYNKNEIGINRVGFSISKKIGKAHKRNRYKRVLREIYTKHFNKIKKSYDFILLVRKTDEKDNYLSIEKIFLKIFEKANLKRILCL